MGSEIIKSITEVLVIIAVVAIVMELVSHSNTGTDILDVFKGEGYALSAAEGNSTFMG